MTGSIRVFVPDGEFGHSQDIIRDIPFSIAAGSVGFLSSGNGIAVELRYQDIPDIIAALMKAHADPHNRETYAVCMRIAEGEGWQ